MTPTTLLIATLAAFLQATSYRDVRELRAAAEEGDTRAQYELAYDYEYGGPGIKQDYGEAARWYRRAAEAGYSPAQNALGALYRAGLGVRRDYGEAAKWYRKAADQDNPGAQANLAQLYLLGQGVPHDDGQAIEWLHKATAQGFAGAYYELGVLYEQGRGVARDDDEAVRRYREAVEGLYPRAMPKLAAMYEHGRGVEKDVGEAYMWYRVSAAFASGLRSEDGLTVEEKCNALARAMTPESVADAERRAAEWLQAHRRHRQP